MRSYSRWYIPAASILLLLSALQITQRAVAQISCTVTYNCHGNSNCAAAMGGPNLSQRSLSFASAASCSSQAATVFDGTVASCSCGSSAAANIPSIPAGGTAAQQLGTALGQAGANLILQGVRSLFSSPPPPPPGPGVQQRALEAHQLNESGIYLLKQRNYAGAINDFQQALAISPSDTTIASNLAIAKQMQRNAALAGQNSNALAQLLGSLQQTSLGPNGALNLVKLGSDTSVVDLSHATGTTVDPATLKGQLDNIFSNNPPTAAQSNSQGAPQPQDIDKLFATQSSPATSAQGNVDSFNAQCSGAGPGSAASAACGQQQAGLVEDKTKQLDQILNAPSAPIVGPDEQLKDAPNGQSSGSSPAANNAGSNGQPAAGGQTSFFGSSNGVTTANAGLSNSVPTKQVTITSTTDALTSTSKSGAAANAAGSSNETGSVQSGYGFDKAPNAPPTAIPINKAAPQMPAATALAAQIPSAAMTDPRIQNAIQNGLNYYGHLDASRADEQQRLDLIQQQINSGTGDVKTLGTQKQILQSQLLQTTADETGAKSQIKDILVKNNYSINANWGDASTPATATQSQSTNGTPATGGSTPQ